MSDKIAILGLGLMGGSLAKAVRAYLPKSTLATLKRNDVDQAQAIEAKMIDKEFETLDEMIAWADLLILAAPLSAIVPLARTIWEKREHIQGKLVVMDIGSVKLTISRAFEELSCDKIEFVATHPMAGSEKAGFEHSLKTLFQDAPWIVVPHHQNEQQTLDRISVLIEKLGANPLKMDAETHDRKIALISHFPALLSRMLLEFVLQEDPESLRLAGPGFHSMTRLAREPLERFQEMAGQNRENLEIIFKKWLVFNDKK